MPFGTIIAAGWATGLNLYATVLLIGLSGRFGWAEVPEQLQEPWLLTAAGVMFAIEFVVDKVPWLDSGWDTVHTAIRPLGGALLGVALAGDAGTPELVAALAGGGFSLTAHTAKASTRALANTSPEPVSNIALSLGEDSLVAVVVALALAYPVAAGVIAVVLAVVSLVAGYAFYRLARRLQRRWRDRRAARAGGAPPPTAT